MGGPYHPTFKLVQEVVTEADRNLYERGSWNGRKDAVSYGTALIPCCQHVACSMLYKITHRGSKQVKRGNP